MKKTFKHSKFTAVFTDENGYFSLTGDYAGGSGAIGDHIAKIDDRFKLLNEMHLANCKTGEPMHALENAFYFFEQHINDNSRTDKSWSAAFHVIENYWKVKLTSGQRARIAAAMTDNGKIVKTTALDIGKDGKPLFNDTKAVITDIMEKEIKPQWKEKAAAVYDLVDEIESNLVGEFINPYDEDGNPISDEYEEILDSFDEPQKAIAAAMQENVDISEVEEDENRYTAAGIEYMVLTDEEADEAATDYILDSVWAFNTWFLVSHLPDGFSEDIVKRLQETCESCNEALKSALIDEDKFVSDAIAADGRGHFLSGYDGYENEQTVDGETFYL